MHWLLVDGGDDMTAFDGDDKIKEYNLLGRVVDYLFKDAKNNDILLEALPMMVILPMTTHIADPNSNHVINKATKLLG